MHANAVKRVIFDVLPSRPEMFSLSAHFQTVLKDLTYAKQVKREEGEKLSHTKKDLNFFAFD